MTGRVTIITGAGSGIGQALAVLMSQRGDHLVLVGRTRRKVDATRAALPASASVMVLEADVAHEGAAERIVDATVHEFGRVDVLVNNAAIGPAAALGDTTRHMLQDVFEANVFGPAMMIARAWPAFARQRSGCVINVSSMAAVSPFPGLGVYAASKCALDSFTRSIASEGRTHGIRSFSVAPGAVETPMLRSLFSERQLPTSRTLDPQAVASVIVECIEGQRQASEGTVIVLPSP